jgi:Fe-S cluster biogenesis protein NfuA
MGVLRRRADHADRVAERIRATLRGLEPILGLDACAVTLVSYQDGVATLRLHGDCPDPGCTMSVAHFRSGIEAHLRMRVPEIVEVRTTGPNDEHGSHPAG